jgi:hypothetical protein
MAFLPGQAAALFIHQKDVEEFVVNDFFQPLRHALDQFIQIENRDEFDAQFVNQALQTLRRVGFAGAWVRLSLINR